MKINFVNNCDGSDNVKQAKFFLKNEKENLTVSKFFRIEKKL